MGSFARYNTWATGDGCMSRRECSEHRLDGNWGGVSSSEVHTWAGWVQTLTAGGGQQGWEMQTSSTGRLMSADWGCWITAPTKIFQAWRVSMGSRQPCDGEVQTQTRKELSSSSHTLPSDIPREHPALKAPLLLSWLERQIFGCFLLIICKRGWGRGSRDLLLQDPLAPGDTELGISQQASVSRRVLAWEMSVYLPPFADARSVSSMSTQPWPSCPKVTVTRGWGSHMAISRGARTGSMYMTTPPLWALLWGQAAAHSPLSELSVPWVGGSDSCAAWVILGGH